MFAVVAFFRAPDCDASLVFSLPRRPSSQFLFTTIAAQWSWWHYPSVSAASTPLAWYVAAALWYGAALGLVGWRVTRRWAPRGLVAFLALQVE
jgi:hypothetical protein